MAKFPIFSPLESPNWTDYALLDSGDGLKLERFGRYTFVRPEVQAMWSRALHEKEWSGHMLFIDPSTVSWTMRSNLSSGRAAWKQIRRHPARSTQV